VKPSLNRPARERLQAALDRLLSGLVVADDWPDFDQYKDIAAFHRELTVHEPWRSHLDTFDLFELLAHVMRQLGIKVEGSKKLVDTVDKEVFATFGKAVRDRLLSIPRQYELWLQLPAMPQWGVGRIKISERIELAEIEKEKQSGREEVAEAMAGLPKQPVTTGKNAVYLIVHTSGYGGGRLNTTAVADGVSHLKQFFQMFRRTSAFRTEGLLKLLGEPARIKCWIVDKEFPDRHMTVRLAHSLNKFLASATIDEAKLKVADLSKVGFGLASLLTAEDKVAETREERTKALESEISWIRKVLDSPPTEDADRIRSAFEWAFDSEENDNETLAFIQACIGLEALLGDRPDEEPLVARLKDRCAYLLGNTHAEREAIRKQFTTMYDVRSKLIHGRASRLSISDAQQLHYAQTILSDVISEESRRLLKVL
jgi:hypothetical protein